MIASSREVSRDPVTGVEAREPSTRPPSEMSSRELEEEIRRTRARMASSLNDVEARISPAHLKQEMQESIQGAIEDVREHFHPRRMAKRAGDTMMDTIKENPLPALVAGASIGYLIVKATRDDKPRPPYGDRWTYVSRSEFERPYGGGEGFAAEEFRNRSRHEEGISGRAAHAAENVRERAAESLENARERAGIAAERAREEASETWHSAQDRARRAAHAAQERAVRTGRRVQHGARAAESEMTRFVHDNPLVAGAIAVGIGALIGSLLPSTEMENRMSGEKRDALVDRAKEAGDEARQRARNVASAASEELRGSAGRIADAAKAEGRELKESVVNSGNGSREEDEFGL